MKTLQEFLSAYPVHEPNLSVKKNDGELQLLTEAEGVRLIDSAPATWAEVSPPPKDQKEFDEHDSRYLWIFNDCGIPCVKEISEFTLQLESKKAKHTNLSGGGNASVGGEAYFGSQEELYLTGSSGRYRFQNNRQLDDAVEVFKELGFSTCCLGWDTDRDRPNHIYREGVAQWI